MGLEGREEKKAHSREGAELEAAAIVVLSQWRQRREGGEEDD